ncbi:carbohydrate ABC transporter permease [Pelagovum pacificum]|uniref:Sugar ABC transporter permease n=1 Tax=Pelagovum pacificum TaxID=2588711 RepID=A0A5C5G912_9RHOB|nr:sugar ABC transporter permease [Pelagovum pacificum]QQA41768.1 sugar ABC transporter permease [Pelagovum pacificum]TNY31041.1 sugar ABC transporter permease [Pelagovum pacificum]
MTPASLIPRLSRPAGDRAPGDSGYGWFVLPALILSLCIMVVPGLLTFRAAFTEWDGVSEPWWVGLDNFRELNWDPVFWQAIANNLRWTALFLTIPMALGLVAASCLMTRRRSAAIYQVVLLLPYVLSPIANASMWKFIIFDPISGVVSFMAARGWDVSNPLADPDSALYAVAAVDIWHFWGYLAVIFFAAMRQTPADQLEAAYLEGANAWQVFRHVTLPNILPTIALMVAMTTIFSFLTFDYVYLLTGGGPANSTELLSTMAYNKAFRTFQVGMAAAIALVMALFGLLASVLYVWLSRESLK